MGEIFNAVPRRLLVMGVLLVLAACGGGGGGGGGSDDGATTTVSGKITFDRVPVDQNGRLDFNAVTQADARQIVVEAISASNSAVLATTTTDTSGNYSLTVPTNTNMFIRAKAQMTKAGSGATWSFSVKNNTNGNALYVLDGSTFSSGSSGETRDLNAASGWNSGSGSYTGTRAAAPFAILDTIFRAKEMLIGAQDSLAFPALDFYWSPNNIGNTPGYCPSDGRISTTSYVSGNTTDNDCGPGNTTLAGIYVLGSVSGNDTDEFDQHVIAHEFGHYVEDKFSRSDSIGGNHGPGNFLDSRVAFGEGWGNAFGAMTLNDSLYKDTSMSGSLNRFDLENNSFDINGWFSEMSVGQLLWDVFDDGTESGDAVALGFEPIFTALTGPYKDTGAMTTVYSFMAALRAQDTSIAQQLDALESGEEIDGRGEFVEISPESNNGGNINALPLYTSINFPGQINSLCTDAARGKYNKLNNRRFVRLMLPSSAVVTINVFATSPTQDPDLILWRRGQQIAVAVADGSSDAIQQVQLAAGDYIIEAYDFAYASPDATGSDPTPHCMQLNVTGG